MATPVNNNAQDVLRGAGSAQNVLRGTDSPALTGNNKTLPPETQRLASGQEREQPTATSGSDDDDVTVSRAAQVLNQQTHLRGEGVIKSADQAAQLAKGLSALFGVNSSQGLTAQTGNVTQDLMGLLKAG